ncbi:MAG: CHAT domain-containing protein, partial [Bacteroidota bacterium]
EKDNEVLKELLFTYQLSYRNYIENLEKEYPEYYKLKYDSKIASIPELQAQISDNTAILSYFLGDEETFLFSITQDKVLVSRRPSSGKLERLLKGFSNAIRFKMETALTSTSADLRDLLIPSLPSKINQLVIIPDGPLGKLPFEALISKKENRFLLQNYRVSYDYSATLLLNRKKEDETESPQILLMAPVEFDNQDVNLGSLPGTREEIEEIALLFRGNNHKAALKIGPAASESNLKNIPPEPYQFLHLATHGVVNEFSPALSRIFLTGGEDEDGSLYTGEIYNLKIDADLVTLSACETGLGKESKGEGIVGLSRALQYAGANNIIVSLWQVGDQSTSDLMIEFYKYYLHNTHHGYNTALRQAKLSLLNSQSYQSPYYWAPFILVGR